MKITDKDQLRPGDDARFHHDKSVMGGPVRALTQGADGGPVISVTVEGFEHSITVHDHAARGGWLWEFDGAERHYPSATVGTAQVRPGQTVRRAVFRTDGVSCGGERYPWVDEYGNLLKDDEIVDFRPEPAPDYAAAVDSYARQIDKLRRYVGSTLDGAFRRADLEGLLTQRPTP